MCSKTNGHDAVHVTLIIKSIQLNMWIAEGSAFYLNYRKWQFSGTLAITHHMVINNYGWKEEWLFFLIISIVSIKIYVKFSFPLIHSKWIFQIICFHFN